MRRKDTEFIIPEVVKSCEEVFSRLEERHILKRFLSCQPYRELHGKPYDVNELYSTDEIFGGHKLICVNYDNACPELGYHEEKEDFILISAQPENHKPLYLLVGLAEHDVMKQKIMERRLGSEDFLIVELVFNDPVFSFFTMNSKIPHCELTQDGDKRPHPYFFVTEPRDLNTVKMDLNQYAIKLNYGQREMGAKGI